MINKGKTLHGRYVIDSAVGEGGGGVVYRAFDKNLQTYVVVKQIKESASSLLQSRAETDILKGLKHENLPKVLDFFEDEGKVFTVMDLIPGISLSEGLARYGRFDQKTVLSWARQLARALAYLHSQNPPVIHSDIKPGNVMWDQKTGKVCLIDFNISLAFHKGQKSVTWISGGYSPPEQYRDLEQYCAYLEKMTAGTTKGGFSGASRSAGQGNVQNASTRIFNRQTFAPIEGMIGSRVDERSDVYSFGACIYHLLTGRKPEINFFAIAPVSAYDIGLSEGFGYIIQKCMEIDPARRYPDGVALSQAFDQIYRLDSEYRRFWKKRFWMRTAAAGMMAAGLLFAGTGLLVLKREEQVRYQVCVQEAEKLLEEQEFEDAAKLLDRARRLDPGRVDADGLELLALYSQGEYDACIQRGLSMLGSGQYRLKNKEDRKRMGDLYYVIGRAFSEVGQEEDAVRYYEEAMEYDEENGMLFQDYAIALARCGQVKEAEKALREAGERDVDPDMAEFTEAEICYAKGEDEKAGNLLLALIEKTKDAALKERAALLLNQVCLQRNPDGLDMAIRMLEEVTEEQGVEAQGLKEALAEDYLKRAERDDSGQDRKKALNQYIALYNQGNKTLQILGNMGVLYRDTGNLADAEKMAEEMVSRYPKDYRGYQLSAFLELEKQQNKPDQEKDYSRFLDFLEEARKLYRTQKNQNDREMELLEQLYRDLLTGGWIKGTR